MSNLSKALQEYYYRDRNMVFFRNGQPLNQLALSMWESLGFQQIDASVLSRVIKGERLFTAAQLKAFCGLLSLSKKQEDHLLACLRQDHSSRLDLYAGTTNIPSSLAKEVIIEMTKGVFDAYYKGDYVSLEEKYNLIEQLVGLYSLSDKDSLVVSKALGCNLYLRGRVIANGELSSSVIKKIHPIAKQLTSLSRINHSTLLHGYAYILMSNAYYIAGGYSSSLAKHRFYKTSIKLAKKAMDSLPADDHESLFALRLMAASACYTQDSETVLYVVNRVREEIPKQPIENYINALHLNITLSKGLAATKISNPSLSQKFAANHFNRSLSGTGVYEISAIKEEVDTLLLLKTQDNSYIRRRLKEGLDLANEHNFSRQKKYFKGLLGTL